MGEWETRIQIWLKVGTVPPAYVQVLCAYIIEYIHVHSKKIHEKKKLELSGVLQEPIES